MCICASVSCAAFVVSLLYELYLFGKCSYGFSCELVVKKKSSQCNIFEKQHVVKHKIEDYMHFEPFL